MTTFSWLTAALLTFAASIHCVGMCGGFVAALGAFRTRRGLAVFFDQILLQLGKASTYAFLGALMGAFGATLLRSAAFTWTGRLLALLAGIGLAAAAASGSPASGALILAGVALGTVPALTAVAVFGSAVPLSWRRNLARGAGVLLLIVGMVTFARGVGLHAGHGQHGMAGAAHMHHH